MVNATASDRRLLDVHDDVGDVVVTTAIVGELDQALRGGLDVAFEQLRNLGVLQIMMQTVRAEQERVAGQHVEIERVDLHAFVHADGARHGVLEIAVRRGVDGLARDLAALDELVEQRVIFGELHDVRLAEQIDARVADVRDETVLADEHQRRAGRAHAALFGLGLAAPING